MRYINNTIRNMAVLITLVILTAAVFGLVSRQRESQSITQMTASPTVESLSTPSPSPVVISEATATLYEYGVTIGKGGFITAEPLPILTPTATFEPLTGQAIGGYVFSTARPVPNTVGHSITFFDWLPDKPDKLLIIRDTTFLEVIDTNTGETKLYNDGKTAVKNPVWLPSRQAVAYLTIDKQDYTKQYLWISEGNQGESISSLSSPAFTTSWISPLATTSDGNGVILFDANWRLTQVGTLNTQSVKLATDTQSYRPTAYSQDDIYQIVPSPDKIKAIYFNQNWLLLADFVQGTLTPINLEALKTESMPPTLGVQHAVWSLDGNKLALTTRIGGIREGNSLFILDLQSGQLSLIKEEFEFITGFDWAPDNQHLIISVPVGLRDEGYSVNALFIVDIISGDIRPIAAIPPDAIGSTPNWSPNGKHIAVLYADKPRNPGLYIIDVQLP
jgi:hypothetical protein